MSQSAQKDLLNETVSRCRKTELQPVVVFDLDGTVLDNRPRVSQIFHELGDHWATRLPAEAARLKATTPNDIGYGLKENLSRIGITDEALSDEAFSFWKDRFFIDSYMRYDVETKGAVDFVKACYDAGAAIVYLTGRDLPNMALGTFASLRDTGFPIGVVGTSLVTKPAFEIPDSEFKDAVAPGLRRHGHVVATFDNEPANTNLFCQHHPDALNILIDTHHAPNPPKLDPRAPVIESFLR